MTNRRRFSVFKAFKKKLKRHFLGNPVLLKYTPNSSRSSTISKVKLNVEFHLRPFRWPSMIVS